jgi:hypothetical protein
LPAFTIARLGLQKPLRDTIEALGCPTKVTHSSLASMPAPRRRSARARSSRAPTSCSISAAFFGSLVLAFGLSRAADDRFAFLWMLRRRGSPEALDHPSGCENQSLKLPFGGAL